MNKFLFELGTEEIPAAMIPPALDQFGAGFQELLQENQVAFQSVELLSSPRRLTVLITGLPDRQPDTEELILGPSRSVAFNPDGVATKAAQGFARKMGVPVGDLEIVDGKKGSYLGWRQKVKGRAVQEILREGLPGLIGAISWPKSMYWRDSRFRFIRPLRWFVLLWNSDVVDFEFEGIRSSRSTQGHRFLHQDGVTVDRPEEYKDCLRKAFVLVDPEERRSKIQRELEASLKPGLRVAADDELFEMVSNLNEYPSVLRGRFGKQFLNLPQEVLVTVMRHHQKYFSVVDEQGAIQPLFLTVVDTSGDPEGVIRKGHERVLKARLEDAAFFWKNDQNRSLEDRYKSLDQVLFQNNLGTYFDKTQRIRAICRHLNQNADLDAAARLCKADLTTEMVFEMPELQGVMGGLYAREAGHPEAVWKAIYEHYRPQSMEDDVPETLHGALLSLSDKLDTIVGCFGMGVIPKGSRDPFALRRQAQGLVRLLLEHRLDYTLPDLVELAEAGFEATRFQPGGRARILDFLCQRVVFVCREKGISYDVMNAVAAGGMDQVFRTYQRATALQEIRRQADFEALAIAFKRVKNILSNQDFEKTPVVEEDLEDQSEQKLYRDLEQMRPEVRKALDESDYLGALQRIARLRRPVDAFFDEVLVLTEDARLRNNRLRLLHDISELFLEIADISEIVSPAR